MVTIPTYGNRPLARPTMSLFSSHSCPGAYRLRSSTWLLSPLVRNLTSPLLLKQSTIKNLKYETKFRRLLFVYLDDTVHNWNIATANFEHHNVSHSNRFILRIREEQQVTTEESRLHAAGQNDDDGWFTVGGEHQPLPDHQRRRYNHAEAEHLE